MIQDKFDSVINSLLDQGVCTEVAVSVSGGVDSIVLLYLLHAWRQRQGQQVKIVVLIVNHNIRPEAKLEVEFVQKTAHDLGHDCYMLCWSDNNQESALQQRARAARYALLSQKCHEIGIKNLLTAHHYDDLIENYIMRKRKKSGAFGLSYSATTFCDNIQVIRPLLTFFKDELLQYAIQRKIQWMEDGSNAQDIYERNRVRMWISSLNPQAKYQISQEMELANNKAQRLNHSLLSFMARSVQITNYGVATIDLQCYQSENQDVKVYVLNYLLTIISGQNEFPRYRSVAKLLELLAKTNSNLHCSLHGCILTSYANNKLLILRERAVINTRPIKLQDKLLWDGRFSVKLTKPLQDKYYISTLSTRDYSKIKAVIKYQHVIEHTGKNRQLILFTLPVITTLEKIIAIPHISYYDVTELKEGIEFFFSPSFVSRFIHFF